MVPLRSHGLGFRVWGLGVLGVGGMVPVRTPMGFREI